MLVAAVMVVFSIKSIVIIRPFERGVVERFGRYNRTLGAGLSIILPFIEVVYRVDMREALIDVPSQDVITKDNVNISVDAVIYFKVTDPFRVMYNVAMFEDAISKLAQTNLRNIIGDLNLDSTLASREKINTELRKTLDEITDRWGVRVTRVEIQDIEPPRDIVDAMSRQMKAERTKRAAILEAEGIKESEILKAEGKKFSEILAAEGEATAIATVADAEKKKKVLISEGEARAISKVFDAIHKGRATKDILMIKYLEALEKMADGKATKIFMPVETSGVLSGAAALGEMLKGEGGIPGMLGEGGKKGKKKSPEEVGEGSGEE
ncbi:MAG: SPFH/Band 7/PHB domain protein [Candidatus Altiarchaeales archaeon]|nr:SPFH/Band 7/PHB domain protein [Candidatus Altiarchaeales archaeon]MBD3416763.1 SPFH/Band 7/PHB domain protein [Candidatus Altiarchaeales archaeon]